MGAKSWTSSRHLVQRNDKISPNNSPSTTTYNTSSSAPLRGIMYDIQTNYEIKLNDVKCTRGEWGSCEYSEDTRYCDHEEDVFLSCHGNLVI